MYKKNDDHFEKSKMPATGQATAAHSKWEEFRSSFHPENPKTPTQAMEQQHNHARSQLDALVRARRDRNPDAWLRAIQQNAAQFNIPTELHVPLVLGEVYNQTLQTSVTCAARAKEGVLSSAGASSLESASAPTSAGASSSEGAPASSIGIKRKRAAATPVLMPDVQCLYQKKFRMS